MNWFGAVEDSQENIYFPTNFNKNGRFKHRSRLGRRKVTESVTHPMTPVRSLAFEAKQGEVLKDIGNIHDGPNPNLNDSFISDSSSTTTDTKSSVNDAFKTPGRSFYTPGLDQSHIDHLKGVLDSPRDDGTKTMFYSPAGESVKKNPVNKALFENCDADKSLGVCNLLEEKKTDLEKNMCGTLEVDYFCSKASTHPQTRDRSPSTETSPTPTPGLAGSQDRFNKSSWRVDFELKTPFKYLFDRETKKTPQPLLQREKESHTDSGPCAVKETTPQTRFHKTQEHVPTSFSSFINDRVRPQSSSSFLKPIPSIDKITKNISNHFSSNSTPKQKDSSGESLENQIKISSQSVDSRPSLHIDKPMTHLQISSKPSCEVPSSLFKQGLSRSEQNPVNNYLSNHNDKLLVASSHNEKHMFSSESHLNRPAMESLPLNRILANKDTPLRNFGEISKRTSSFDSVDGMRSEKNGDLNLFKQVPNNHKIQSVDMNLKFHHDSGKNRYHIPNSNELRNMAPSCESEAMPRSGFSALSVPSDEIDLLRSGHHKKKSSKSLFQASLIKSESSIMEGNEAPNNHPSLNLFHSSIVKGSNERECRNSGSMFPFSSDRSSKSSLQSSSNKKGGSSILNCDLMNEGLINNYNPVKNLQQQRGEKVVMSTAPKIVEQPLNVFKKPSSIVPKIVKQSPRIPETVYVNGVCYQVLSLLGQGGSSKVYQVMREDNKLLAIKCVDLKSVDQSIAESYLNEINMLASLQMCPSVIKMYGHEFMEHNRKLLVVMEKGDTDFATLIKSITKTKKISMPMIIYYWTEILNCVNDIHEKGIIHSDLKPANFLLQAGRLKIIDFGISSSLQDDMTSVVKDTTTGTYNYMSPEAIINHSETQLGHKISYKSDVWSLGCILYQLLYGKTPYSHYPAAWGRLQAIADPKCIPAYPDKADIPIGLQVALRWCLNKDPKRRPTTRELMNIPYYPPTESTSRGVHIKSLLYAQIMEMFPHCSVQLE